MRIINNIILHLRIVLKHIPMHFVRRIYSTESAKIKTTSSKLMPISQRNDKYSPVILHHFRIFHTFQKFPQLFNEHKFKTLEIF